MYDVDKMFPCSVQTTKFTPTCWHCDGRGVIPQDNKIVTCPKCNGTGKDTTQEVQGLPKGEL